MFQPILTAILLSISFISFSQSSQQNLAGIKTVPDAASFIQKNPNSKAKIITIVSSNDTSEILVPLYNKKAGFTFSIGNNAYKILKVDSTLSFRVSYIYLNGEQFSKTQIDSLRQEIISKYQSGTAFYELAQQHNMDGNVTGDTGWFAENMMVPEFEKAVKNHKKGEIFTVDTPESKWYHVVLKTFDDTFIKKVTLLKAPGGE